MKKQKLIDEFSKFPTIGPRTAARFVFYLIHLPVEKVENLTNSILELKKAIKICTFCFNSYEGDQKFCEICLDPRRDKTLLCIVEKETDLISIEKTKTYKGFYFVLGGTVSTLKKQDIEKLRIKELIQRIKKANFKEIILALNPTTEGEATILYLERALKPLGRKITHLARGLPTGAELEYADKETLKSALQRRE
ncbi:recombination protein RecR [Candidatus Parcubacteria bacterium]|nr:recombination protein RecR [Candidatus Parcubacteria bacterium]